MVDMKFKILLVFAIIPAFWALTKPGYFPMHDDIQGMRVLQMHKCVFDLQIPCRWVPDMGYGYGYPQFNYYSPLPYYFMEGFVIAGNPILDSVKVGFASSIIFSGLSMYFLAKYMWGKKGGLIAALFYTYAPYRAVDVYVRGAMGEAWAFVFLPLILLYTLKVLDGEKKIIQLSLAIAGLLLSHNVSVVMFTPFYFVFLLLIRKFNLNSFKNVIFSGVWGFALSSFFIMPAFLEKSYVHVDTILAGYFNYLAHYVGLKQLLLSTYWGYGSSSLGTLDGMNLSVGMLHWTLPLCLMSVMLLTRRLDKFRNVILLVSLGAIALFLVHPRSQFLWDNLPMLSFVQFPWRFLLIAVLFLSLAVGSVGPLLLYRPKVFIAAFYVLLILFYGSYFFPKSYVAISDHEKFSGENWRLQQTISIFDYLPKSAAYPPAEHAPLMPITLEGEAGFSNGKKGTNWQRWDVVVGSSKSVIAFSVFDFPNWEVKVDGEVVKHYPSGDLGLVTIEMQKGIHSVDLVLKDTFVRISSNIVSMIALVGVIAVIIKKKEWYL